MNNDRLLRLIEGRLAKIQHTRNDKSSEYAGIEDQLANFKDAATLLQCTPEKALLGFVTKHIIALYSFVEELEVANDPREYSYWDEKIGDIMIYMMLLEALIVERMENIDV